MMYKSLHTTGFTLVEMIIALALFSVVSTVSIGALLVLIDNNRELRDEQALITNVSFAMDMMTREIRAGYEYVCETMNGGQDNQFRNDHNAVESDSGAWSGVNRNCHTGKTDNVYDNGHRHLFSFVEGRSLVARDERRIAYIFDPRYGRDPSAGIDGSPMILRRVGNEEPQPILSSSINLLDADFRVAGVEMNHRQPTATIYMEVEAEDGATFEVQTTVTQRFLDI